MRRLLLAGILLALSTPVTAQTVNWDLAARFAPYRMSDLVHSTSVNPRWIEGGESFWYEWDDATGTHWRLVDPVRGTKSELFDRDWMAAEITRIVRDPFEARHLPIRNLKFVDANTIRFEVTSSQKEEVPSEEAERGNTQQDSTVTEKKEMRDKVFYFEYDRRAQVLRELTDPEKPDNHPSWASVSPDGAWVLFARHENLYKMSGEDYVRILDARRGKTGDKADEAEKKVEVEEIQLTHDGEEFFSYVASTWRLGQHHGDTAQEVEKKKDDRKRAPIVWSPGSEYFTVMRMDVRKVGDLWIIHSVGNERPELETYKYGLPGEENVAQYHLEVGSVVADSVWALQDSLWVDQEVSVFSAPQFRYAGDERPFSAQWLTNDPGSFLLYRMSRDHKRVDLLRADAASGQVDVVLEERFNTYIDVRTPDLLSNGDFIWWSERDGWAHLYRYAADGTLRNRLTRGPWSVRGVQRVDEDRGHVFFQANARESGEDPYYQHLYRVGLDGSDLRLLNPGDRDHRSSASESGRYFVTNFSRVDQVPRSTVLDASGRTVVDLETADFSSLFAAGFRFPEPYTVKAADGITDLYGVMYKPFDFDSTRTYPIVEYVYPGPQTEAVAKMFTTAPYETALAQFGMIVVTVGNRGGHPDRSKWYHTYGYGNLRDYGLADKKAAAEQLADRHDWIDLDRVGIYGHSGGGFMSTAAMLVYPDFFKVAVSSSGNHDNTIYNRNWSEHHHGVEEVVSDSGDVSFKYDIDTNQELAKNLKGRLLLVTSDEDNNVHPAATIRMADALIKANKRFDFFLFPGQRHGYGNMSDYWFWLRAEYFVEHLLGETNWNADIIQLNREEPQGR
ncbi:MAG: DPP IV N-terminal domain-containing protein [Rhodothermales bacterium]